MRKRFVVTLDSASLAMVLMDLGGLARDILERSPRWRAARAATVHTAYCWRSNYRAERAGQVVR